ncbi:MAG TPA: B12-binding domain-containing radical SAM protein [Alphaproteobacteria bacterium]|nr:B12-binding domain-containing radical SAM protein [Alphaproteobacteria bacterium]
MNILMIYPKFPEQIFWNTSKTGEVFVHRPGIMPPLGLLTIASYLPDDFQTRVVDRNVREESAADWEWADVVFISMMVTQLADYRLCVDNARRHRKPIAVGGPFTHAMPEVAIADADWVCIGEAEAIMEELVSDLRADRRGKQYQGGNATNMQAARLPRFECLPDLNDYCSMAIQFSRGCPFRCEFCDIIEIYGRVPRTKTPAQILAELTALKRLGYRGYVFLVDDNFIGNKKNAKAMLKEIAVWNRDHGYPFRFYTEASINLADDDELLEAMSQANFLHVFIGIETPDPALLKTTLKVQNIPGNPLEKLRKIRQHGIHITAGFILGFDGEQRGVFEAQRAFIQASGIGIAMTGLLQAIPHTQLHRRLKSEGRLLEKAHLQVNTTVEGLNFIPKGEMTKREYLQRYRALVQELYGPKAYFARILPAILTLRNQAPWRATYVQWRRGFPILLRLFYHLGFKARRARGYFWKTFFQVLWKNPAALEAWGYDCFYFHHLNQHAQHIQAALARYLASPSPDDVLDEVIRDSESLNAAG